MPLQVPSPAVSVWPAPAVPEIAGATTETGGAASIGPTVVDGTEVCSPLSPVTITRTVEPTSSEPSVYVASVAPEMSTQLAPAASQRCHW